MALKKQIHKKIKPSKKKNQRRKMPLLSVTSSLENRNGRLPAHQPPLVAMQPSAGGAQQL